MDEVEEGPKTLAARKKISDAVDELIRAVNEEDDHSYFVSHYVIIVECVLAQDEGYSAVLTQSSTPTPSLSKQLGLVNYVDVRLRAAIAGPNDDI